LEVFRGIKDLKIGRTILAENFLVQTAFEESKIGKFGA